MFHRRRQLGRPAFTLLELIVVMVLIAITLAAVAPSLRGFSGGREVDTAAGDMLLLIRLGHMRAVQEARPYRFQLDPRQGRYGLLAQDGASFTVTGEAMGRTRELPPGVRAEWVDAGTATAAGYVTLWPNGTADPGRIRVTGDDDVVRDVVCSAPAETFRIVAAAREELN